MVSAAELVLHYHPLASFCHKVLIALYERKIPFEPFLIDLADPASASAFRELWPLGKMPVLQDRARDRVIPETSIIIEYLEARHASEPRLIPLTTDAALQARLWDRFFDLYVSAPVQKIVIDRLRSDGEHDPRGVAEARASLQLAYTVIDRQLVGKRWAIGDAFTMADCAALPALFYAHILEPFAQSQTQLSAYFERLLERPSVQRTLAEARPYFTMFPYYADMPKRFL